MIDELIQQTLSLREQVDGLVKPESGSFRYLDETTLLAPAASVTFASIPATFRALQFWMSLRSDVVAENDAVLLRFNADSGNNYNWQALWANAAAAAGATNRGISEIRIGNCEGASSTANAFSPCVAFIDSYQLGSMLKFAMGLSVTYGDVSADADVFSLFRTGRWNTGDAIASTTILPNTGPNFVSGSIFKLYGII